MRQVLVASFRTLKRMIATKTSEIKREDHGEVGERATLLDIIKCRRPDRITATASLVLRVFFTLIFSIWPTGFSKAATPFSK